MIKTEAIAHLISHFTKLNVPFSSKRSINACPTMSFNIRPAVPLPTFKYTVVTVDTTGTISHRRLSQSKFHRENLGRGVLLDLVAIPKGQFWMGATEEEENSLAYEQPRHLVNVPSFFMGRYPVTQAQWSLVADWEPVNRKLRLDPSHFKGNHYPVENVAWHDAVEFCDRLSQHTHHNYRLPSEAEWEYACRAHTTTPFHFGETISTDVANYRGSYDDKEQWLGSYGHGSQGVYRRTTTPVDYFHCANAFGLSDIHGNVWEWCADHWHDSYQKAPQDASPWISGNANAPRTLRGGSWTDSPWDCRSAYRDSSIPNVKNNLIGFRVVLGIPHES